ncbi:MAG: CDP-diacylglycerol--serine O-phosphatidyltransferase [Cytophagales bacterium]|nr:CDP-diacylglycerol--serine O-phosphatidyltransferase [Cytophagales bacterium]
MKKHIPNFITCLNVLTGAIGIAVVLISKDPTWALTFVIVAAFFDFLDGLVARVLNLQSEFGKQLDSLADLISFGVLPAFAFLVSINSAQSLELFDFKLLSPLSYFGLLVVPFSALRLAKFNLATDQSDEFKGLPVPANALMITTIAFAQPDFIGVEVLLVITAVSCFLLVSNIPMIALKFKSLAWKGNELRYSLLILEILCLIIFQLSFIPFVIPTYIVVSVIGNSLYKTFVS